MYLTLGGLAVELGVVVLAIRTAGWSAPRPRRCSLSGLLFVGALWVAGRQLGSIVSKLTLLRAGLAFALTVALGHQLSNGSRWSLLLGPVLALVNLGLLLVTRETRVSELLSLLKRSPPHRADGRARRRGDRRLERVS